MEEIKLGKGEQRVFDFMTQFGSITSLEAFTELGETRLSGRIFSLRQKGIPIDSSYKSVCNRFGEKRKVKEYKIV